MKKMKDVNDNKDEGPDYVEDEEEKLERIKEEKE